MRAHPTRPSGPPRAAAATPAAGGALLSPFPRHAEYSPAARPCPLLLSRPSVASSAYQGDGDGYGRAAESRGGRGGPRRSSDGGRGRGGGGGGGRGRGGGGRGGGRGRGRSSPTTSSRRAPAPPGDDFVIIGRAAGDGDEKAAEEAPQAEQQQSGGGGGYAAARAAALAADPRLDGAAFWAAALGEGGADEDEDEDDEWEDEDEDDDLEAEGDDSMLSPAALMAELGLLPGGEEEGEGEDASDAPPAKATTEPPSPTTRTNWRDVYTSSSLPQPFIHPSIRLTRVGNNQGRGVVASAPVAAGEALIVASPLGTVLYCEQGTTPENEELAAHLLLGPGKPPGGADAALRFFAKPTTTAKGGGAAGASATAPPLPTGGPRVSRPAAELLLRYLAPSGPAGSAENLPLPSRELWEAAAGVGADAEEQQQAPLAELLLAVPPDPALAAAEGGIDETPTQNQQRQLARFASLVGANALGEASEDAALAVLRGTALCASGFLALWPAAAGLANHSCSPSCCWLVVGDRLVLRAARPLAPGDQATLSYLGQALTRPLFERRSELKEVYGFECRCERCRAEEKAREKAPQLAAALDAISAGAGKLAARAEAAAARLEEVEEGQAVALDGAAWGDDEAAMASTGGVGGGGSRSSRDEEEEDDDNGRRNKNNSRSRSRSRPARRAAPTEQQLLERRLRLEKAAKEAREELLACQSELQALREGFERGLKAAAVKKGSAARLWLVASAFDVYDALSVCADALAASSSSEEEEERQEQDAAQQRKSKSRRADAKKRAAAAQNAPPPLETELLATCARALAAVSPGSEPACSLAVELMLRAEAKWRGQGAQEARDAARLAAAQHAARYGAPASVGAATSALLLDTRAGLD